MTTLDDHWVRGVRELADDDPQLHGLLERELLRQTRTLAMVASMSTAPPSVLTAAGSALGNLTTEGYPGQRYHGGCAIADDVERLAVKRARDLFGARYANVQPHSGSSANLSVLFTLMQPGDTLLGMALDAGGHLTHGSNASVTGRAFTPVGYGLGDDGLLDYDEVARLAEAHRPKVIMAGASSYPRVIDFARFRAIADDVGAWLVADISHIAGLVVAGEHPSPVPHAHVVTTSTYKQLCGPRGGVILADEAADGPAPTGKGTLASALQHSVFPRTQGTPDLSGVAAKARALAAAGTSDFKAWASRVRSTAARLGGELDTHGFRLVTGGTDNHMVVIDLRGSGLTGRIVECALEECGVVVNKNQIPGDPKPPRVSSGLRIGTNTLALRGMGDDEMDDCARLVADTIAGITVHSDTEYTLDPDVKAAVSEEVVRLCKAFPLTGYDI